MYIKSVLIQIREMYYSYAPLLLPDAEFLWTRIFILNISIPLLIFVLKLVILFLNINLHFTKRPGMSALMFLYLNIVF